MLGKQKSRLSWVILKHRKCFNLAFLFKYACLIRCQDIRPYRHTFHIFNVSHKDFCREYLWQKWPLTPVQRKKCQRWNLSETYFKIFNLSRPSEEAVKKSQPLYALSPTHTHKERGWVIFWVSCYFFVLKSTLSDFSVFSFVGGLKK